MDTNKIKISYDHESRWGKPIREDLIKISQRIGASVRQIGLQQRDIRELAEGIGLNGHTFCPATFKDGIRKKENFEQQQIFALDFDNKNPDGMVTFEDVKVRADHYNLPILFAYDTFSSKNHDKFRVVFLNDIPIPDREVAEAMQLAMGTIFPEADQSCVRDVSRMYFGGDKEILYCNRNVSKINMESVFMGLTHYEKEKYKQNHYKERLSRFAKETGILLDKRGLLDVSVSDDPTEFPSVPQSDNNGKNSPRSIIYTLDRSNIKGDGEIFPNKYYRIIFDDDTNESSVGKHDYSKTHKNHKPYRAPVLNDMSRKCQLFGEFESCCRKLSHNELYGIATNMIQVESGSSKFMELLSAYSTHDTTEKDKLHKWERDLAYMNEKDYRPYGCDSFCPHRETCSHNKNILSTVHLKRGTMEKLPGYSEQFYSIEDVQDDTYEAINRAFHENSGTFKIIKSMTGAGKSFSYLRLLSENPDARCIIAAPTNLLKDELYKKAKKMGIDVVKTPSLEQISNDIPSNIWFHIQDLYQAGLHRSVHPYIYKKLRKKNIPCLKKYIDKRNEVKKYDGNVITTHRYLLNMDRRRLSKYDAIIIDEDIIYKSVIPNQEEIAVSELKDLLEDTENKSLRKKIRKLLKLAKEQSCITLNICRLRKSDIEDDESMSFDLPAFCQAKKFYVRRKSKDNISNEDTVTFLKHARFFDDVNYIMVSATVNEDICRQYFGEDRVDFYECKKAEYKGTLNQYTQKSMSRCCLANNPGVIDRLMKHFDIDEEKVITFLSENIGTLHFGNTEGSNSLEGKDILVVGTPYHADFLYKLTAFTMGIDFDEDEEMTLQPVVHNGYRFWFTTFKDEGLRTIHFWMIESELEQAVGRARLLRNACEVHLFSNLPISQAKIITNFDYGKE